MNLVRISCRPISDHDVARIQAAFDNRVARYKLQGDWSNRFGLPLSYHHNGTVCIDEEKNSLFTQVPYHFQDQHLERYIVVVGEELATLQSHQYPHVSVAFAAKPLWPELPYIFGFSEASLKRSGNWMSDSIPDVCFFAEASAFTR